jgi:hypothetical protein
MGDDMVICGFNEFTRLSVFTWDSKRYIESKRTLMKTIGSTRHFVVTQLKKSKFQKHQFYCVINKDVCRVNLDVNGVYTKMPGSIHPKDVLFRGEFNIVDYQVID